jgi:hypothetical protein
MGKEPEPGKLPAAADEALERLLCREDRISDLIAFLAALDPEPFLATLGLPVQRARVRREVRLGGQAGNADLVVSDETGPVALLEVKASAAQHGDQFERYGAWAKARTPPARCYLVALDGESLGAPDGWVTEPSLARLVRSWQDSSNPHAAWLASAAAGIFEGWTRQADGKLGSAAGSIVGDLVARRMASALLGVSNHPGILTRATRQSGGGAAMVLAWLPWPGQPPHPSAWLCADFRSTARDRLAAPWMLRLGVEAGTSDTVSAAQARVIAHDLAVTVLDMLTCTAVQRALRQAGEEDLAACLRPRRGTRDGLRRAPDAHGLGEWRANAARPGAAARHPVLFQDNLDDGGYRLASLIDVDVASLDRHQLARLMLAVLGHVQAKVPPGAGGPPAAAGTKADSAG